MSEPGTIPTPDDAPNPVELIELIERLDHDNERLRMKSLGLMNLMEEAVNREVAGERRIEELDRRIDELEAENAALHNTKLMRFTRPIREVYRRLRARIAA